MNQAKILFSILLLLSTLNSVFAERAKSLTFKERETIKQIEAQRKAGFSDVEIDTLHESIAKNIGEIKKLNVLGVDKQASVYLTDIPATNSDIFKLDKENKTFLEFSLPQGQSYVDWPKIYLYDGYAYIYPSENFQDISKIVLMFRRVNAEGDVYVKEMRRLINPTPKSIVFKEDNTVETDSNSDIILEYYQSNTSNTIWPNEPIQAMEPNVTMELNKTDSPLPYEKQKMIMQQYKKILRNIDKTVAKKLRGLQLDQRRMVTKMLEFK